jgi:TRAP-type C4-dicarboxylate transport system permease small subunit
VKRLLDAIDRIINWISVTLAGASILLMCGQILMRFMFGLMERFHGRRVIILKLALYSLTFVTCAFLCLSGIKFLQVLMRVHTVTSSTLETPTWVYFLPFPIGLAGCVLFSMEKVAECIHNLVSSSRK